jgi:hypothetical protein
VALTVTSRGTGTHNTGATTLVPGGRTATLASGSMGVMAIALDNAGAAGAATAAPASWTDAKGNVWTRRINALYDNGAASAGIEMAFYTAPITVALLTTDAGTITWDGAVSPVPKAWTWYEVIPGAGNTVSYSTGGTIAGATAANAQVVTASVPVGDAVIAGYFSEGVGAVTGDSDSTNGSWTAQQTATVGSGTSGVRIATQQKVQTTTASTQSYDVTVASQDRIAGYIMLHELVATVLTPGVATLTTATFAPTVSTTNNQSVTPTTASLTTTVFAPTVTATAHQTVTPTTTALATSTFAPTVTASDHQSVTPSTASLSTATFAPTVTATSGTVATPGIAELVTATFAPTVTATAHQTVTPTTASLSTTGFAPTVAITNHQTVTPTTTALSTTSFAPTVTASDHKTLTPSTAALSLTTFAPNVGSPIEVTPTAASLALATFAPSVVLTDNQLVTPEAAALALSTFVTSVSTSDNQTVTPGLASLVLQAFAPTVTVPQPQVVTPDAASLILTTYIPLVFEGVPDEPGFASATSGLTYAAAATAVVRSSATVSLIGGATSNVELLNE